MSHLHFRNIRRYGFCVWSKVVLLYIYGSFKDAFLYSHTSPIHFLSGMIGIGWSIILLQHDVFSIGNFYAEMGGVSSAGVWAGITGLLGCTQILRAIFLSRTCCNYCRPMISGVAITVWGSIAGSAIMVNPVSTAAAAYGALSIALLWALVRELLEYEQSVKHDKSR